MCISEKEWHRKENMSMKIASCQPTSATALGRASTPVPMMDDWRIMEAITKLYMLERPEDVFLEERVYSMVALLNKEWVSVVGRLSNIESLRDEASVILNSNVLDLGLYLLI